MPGRGNNIDALQDLKFAIGFVEIFDLDNWGGIGQWMWLFASSWPVVTNSEAFATLR